MANSKNKKKGRTTRRPTKAELERQRAIKRMLLSFGLAFILLFAALKLGVFGVTIYNLIRLVVGSLLSNCSDFDLSFLFQMVKQARRSDFRFY